MKRNIIATIPSCRAVLQCWQAARAVFHPAQDEVIQRFEDRCTEANAEIQQLQAALQDVSKRLETADNRLSSTIDTRNKLRKQLEAKHAEMASMQASLQADNEVLQVSVISSGAKMSSMAHSDLQVSDGM